MGFIHNAAVLAQRDELPQLYGRVDFSAAPERWADAPQDRSVLHEVFPSHGDARRGRLLADTDMVDRLRQYTLMGDPVADAYAALIPRHGLRRLMDMLGTACDQGLEAVPDAPPELAAFIGHMARLPGWLDWDLIEEGARAARNGTAHLSPLIIRGAFFATFTNKYAALPMALTGALSHELAARRVLETAHFFTVSVLPGALTRHGRGFKAAAMVRLMHSMVRFHALSKPEQWDTRVFGIPIPQVDQMPAGLISSLLLARKVLKQGRTTFTRAERARVELARYRCHLLGLPEALLPQTPQGLIDILEARAATLRAGFDDDTCGALIRSTMAADLARDPSWFGRLQSRLEPSVARLFFVRNYMNGDAARAAELGVRLARGDTLRAALGLATALVPMTAHRLAQRLPGLRALSDRALVRRLETLLSHWGHAEFKTDASQYRPATPGRTSPAGSAPPLE